jgi:hypothetical protein
MYNTLKKKLHNIFFLDLPHTVTLSPQANYTDWATVTCQRNSVPTFAGRGMSSGQRGGSPRSLISVS